MGKVNQELFFLNHLHFHRQDKRFEEIYEDQIQKKYGQRAVAVMSWRSDTLYSFLRVYICKKMFMLLHDIGDKRQRNLTQHYDNIGLSERTHGLANKPSKRQSKVLSVESIGRIVDFIKNFAEIHAIPLPS